MNTALISQLRTAYDALDTIDPCGEGYSKLCALLDSLPTDALQQLRSARIKFVSKLALNRLIRRGAI